MLLIIEALLFISAAGGRDHSATVEPIFPLDMAENSVDDQFEGCTEKMADLVKKTLLETELKNSDKFKTAWEKGTSNAKEPQDNLKKDHLIAIYAYSDEIYTAFNMAGRNDKEKYIDQTYNWYSFHFLLTEAIQILKEQQTTNKRTCYSTYRGTNVEFDKNVLNTEVRFGSFTSSSLNKKVAEMYSTKSCFVIRTCEGADLTKYSRIPDEEEVLIPPYEKFTVTAVKTRAEQKDPWCDTEYTLESSGKRSDLNCARLEKPTNSFKKILQKLCCFSG